MKTTLVTTSLATAAALFTLTPAPAEAGGYKYSSRSCTPSYGHSSYQSRSYFSKPAYPYHGSSSLRSASQPG